MRNVFLALSFLLFFSNCKKSSSEIDQNLSKTVAAEYLSGPCPYDCHDTRCKSYVNGYCGTLPPDSSLTKDQFIAAIGGYHNGALTNALNTLNYNITDNTTFANAVQTDLSNYFYNNLSTMSVSASTKSQCISYLVGLYSNYSYYTQSSGRPLDSIITSQINQIAPTRTTAESNLLNSALNIFNFSATGMSTDSIFNTILARANTVLTQYNNTTWTSTSGDCIGGYLQIVINSTNYWKYVNDNNGNPPPSGGGSLSMTVGSPTPELSTQPNWSIFGWIRGFAAPELDAAGYLVGWGKAYFYDGIANPNERIKAGLWNAGALSIGKLTN